MTGSAADAGIGGEDPDPDVESDTGRRERRESLERKDRQQAQVLQAQRLESLGQLAGGVAHDFGNLLAVILSYASFVTEELAAPSGPDWPEHREEARSDLRQITLAAELAASLIRQLLASARREVIPPQVLNLDDVITRVQGLLYRTLGGHIELITTLAGDLWPVLAGPGQLERVLINLAVNARDAMPDGGTLTIDTSNITVDATAVAGGSRAPHGKNVRLRISDTGTGIPAAVLEHVFEPFFTTKQDGSGTGLGLATVYGILAQAEGQIQIYTEPGTGATFIITLPVTAQELIPIAEPMLYQGVPNGEADLVVEDEEALREVTAGGEATRAEPADATGPGSTDTGWAGSWPPTGQPGWHPGILSQQIPGEARRRLPPLRGLNRRSLRRAVGRFPACQAAHAHSISRPRAHCVRAITRESPGHHRYVRAPRCEDRSPGGLSRGLPLPGRMDAASEGVHQIVWLLFGFVAQQRSR
jgi:signal transduction histidine kinase